FGSHFSASLPTATNTLGRAIVINCRSRGAHASIASLGGSPALKSSPTLGIQAVRFVNARDRPGIASSIIASSNLPAGPIDGFPSASPLCPGASPTNRTSQGSCPRQRTTLLRRSQRRHSSHPDHFLLWR